MHATIRAKDDGTYTLWVQEKPGDGQPPTYTAQGRTAEQILALLPVILAEAETPSSPVQPRDDMPNTNRKAGAHLALSTVLGVLDGWIEGAQSNHGGNGHSVERRGEECWRSFAPSDIRNMVNDAAREVGVAEFADPAVAKEDELT